MNLDSQLSLTAFLLQGGALGIAAAAAPGPFQAFLISESLVGGWRRGFSIAMAPLVSDLPIVLLALSLLEQLPPLFLRGVSVVGGLFVLYLAWGMWRRWRAGADRVEGFKLAEGSGLRRGALINLLGPGPYLFWTLVLGPVLLAALRAPPCNGGAFVLGFYGVFIGGLLGLVGLFDQARRLGPRVVRALLLVSIVILVVFGVGLLRKGI